MPPLRESCYCYGHDPTRESDRLASRHLGGLRRRRKPALASDEAPVALRTISAILSYLEEAATDLRCSDPGISKTRTQIYLAATAMKAVEISEIERRIAALEARFSPLSRSLP